MGGTASIYWDALNDNLDEDDVKMILGEEYNEKVFHEFKNKETGLMPRSTLMKLVHNHKLLAKEAEVKEIYLLFMQICPNGEMSSRSFVMFLREARLLSKKKLTKADAEIMFEKARHVPKIVSKTMNFKDFMSICIPLIAEKLKLDADVVLQKLASVEKAPTEEEKQKQEMEKESMTSEAQAAMKIQSTARRKSARNTRNGIKEAEISAKSIGPDFFDVPSDEESSQEVKLRDVFKTLCRPHDDMDVQSCIELCQQGKVLNEQFFTIHDVQLAFLKAKFVAVNNEAYKSGVIVRKRVNYKVFREILIPCLAEKKSKEPPNKESKEEIISMLCQVPSDNVEVETESTEALKVFFTILQTGVKKGESGQMDRLLEQK